MWKAKVTVVCLLSLFACGCSELTSTESPKPRSGSMGFTAEGLDDMAKPDRKPATPPPNNGPADPNANK